MFAFYLDNVFVMHSLDGFTNGLFRFSLNKSFVCSMFFVVEHFGSEKISFAIFSSNCEKRFSRYTLNLVNRETNSHKIYQNR